VLILHRDENTPNGFAACIHYMVGLHPLHGGLPLAWYPTESMTRQELRALRKAAGLTQGELAKRLGVALNTVSRWETGGARITSPMARLLRLVLGPPRPGISRGHRDP
jgi:DNA-binding XRE family transcriptional regulator